MPALADLLTDQDRQALLGRLAELQHVDRLIREIPRQRPPDPPIPVTALATRGTP